MRRAAACLLALAPLLAACSTSPARSQIEGLSPKQLSAPSALGSGEVEGQAVKRFAAEGPAGAKVTLAISDEGDPCILAYSLAKVVTKSTSGLTSTSVRLSNAGPRWTCTNPSRARTSHRCAQRSWR